MASLTLSGDSKNWDYPKWGIHFLIFPSKYKPCLYSCNQGRKHSLPGMMILLFLKEVHMDKSEYNLRGVGITKTISVPLFNFFSLFLEMFLGKQWGRRCLVKKKNLEVPRSKGWIGLKMNPCFLNIRNKRGFHKLLLLFFWLCPYYSPFWWASRQKWLFQMIWQLE